MSGDIMVFDLTCESSIVNGEIYRNDDAYNKKFLLIHIKLKNLSNAK